MRTKTKSSENSAKMDTSDVANDVGQLSDLELLMMRTSDKDWEKITALEMELSQLRLELKIANKERERLKYDVETITGKFKKLTSEVDEIYRKESEAEAEIAMLRSKTAAAEESANQKNLALELVNQQLVIEADEAKHELDTFNILAYKRNEEGQSSKVIEHDEAKTGQMSNACISISVSEYEALVKKAQKADESKETNREIDALRREVEAATARLGEFRTRAEHAIWRADVAEKTKALLEEDRKKWIEHEERRKVAFEALRQESISLKNSFKKSTQPPKLYQPLGKLLQMKF